MSNLFEQLKQKQQNVADVEGMVETFNKSEKKYGIDERFWKPTVDANGIGQAVIRFLPVSDPSKEPYILYYNHSFQNPITGKWFIDNCPTSIGRKDCPVCNHNSKLWNTGDEAKKKLASSRKRNLRYVSNVYIISDPKNPEAEGKVFLYTYGTKIFQMLKSCTKPEFEDQLKFNPFNLWTGANFRMKIKPVKKQRSYDSSSFDKCGALADDETLSKICEHLYPLDEFLDPVNYQTNDFLQKKFNDVVNVQQTENDDNDDSDEEKTFSKPVADSDNKYQQFLNKFKDATPDGSESDDDDVPF